MQDEINWITVIGDYISSYVFNVVLKENRILQKHKVLSTIYRSIYIERERERNLIPIPRALC
jgi:hypothetical protein